MHASRSEVARRGRPAALRFERPAAGDGPKLLAVLGDARVAAWLRPAGPAAPFTAAECAARVDAWEAHWRAHGFGPWLVSEGGRPAGYGGLRHTVFGGRPEVEVFWGVAADEWRRGIARTIGARALAAAPGHGITDVAAIARSDNAASLAVIRALGLRHERALEHAGRPHELFRLELPAAAAEGPESHD